MTIIKISQPEVERFKQHCNTVSVLCDVLESEIELNRIGLVKKVLGDYVAELNRRYKALDRAMEIEK